MSFIDDYILIFLGNADDPIDLIQKYEEDPTLVRNIIADGCEKANKLAEETMRDIREAMGLNYS